MSKNNYRGNFTKEELKGLEEDRQEAARELQVKKSRDKGRRSERGNRHTYWLEGVED